MWFIAWYNPARLSVLAENGYMTIADSTHKTVWNEAKLFSLVCRSKHAEWRTCFNWICSNEDTRLLVKALEFASDSMRERRLIWKIRNCLTDDSAGEQLAFKTVFTQEDMRSSYGRVQHFL